MRGSRRSSPALGSVGQAARDEGFGLSRLSSPFVHHPWPIAIICCRARCVEKRSPARGKRREDMPDLFVVMRRYGPPYARGRPLERQEDWEAHRVFMNALGNQWGRAPRRPFGGT